MHVKKLFKGSSSNEFWLGISTKRENKLKQSKSKIILILLLCLYFCVIDQELQLASENQKNDFQAAQAPVHNQKITEIQHYSSYDPIEISSDSEFAIFPGSGTIDDPFRIEGLNITSPDGNLISISDTTSYFCVYNNYLNGLSNTWWGIVLHSVTHGTIKNNIVYNHKFQGLAIYNSNNIIITNNTTFNNGLDGIRLDMSRDSTISNNIISNNYRIGIDLFMSENCDIFQNSILNNQWSGIEVYNSANSNISNNYVFNSGDGIKLYHSERSTLSENLVSENSGIGVTVSGCEECDISHNNISDNEWSGIEFYNSGNNTFTDNNISNNDRYGILLNYNTNYIEVIKNDFIGNNPRGGSQAFDDGYGQNNTFTYNYWDDWTDPDGNADGIVDSPYIIDGEANNQDSHPRASLTHDNTISFSSNVVIGIILLIIILSALFVLIRKQKVK